jgi:hypothetical protein
VYGKVTGVTVVGVRGRLVTVESHVGRGLPSLTLTGQPGAAVQDARDRIRPAIESARLEWPRRRVVVNIVPGNVRKEGPGLDLPVAMSVLAATRQVPISKLPDWAFVGELSLQGSLVSTPGVLSVAIATARAGIRGVVVPEANATEAALVADLDVVGAPTLAEVVGFSADQPTDRRLPTGETHTVDLSRSRPGAGAPGARGRGRGRPQRPPDRLAGRGQDDARAAPAHHLAHDVAGGGSRGDPAALGGRAAPGRARARATVPLAAPHRFARSAPRRRELTSAAGRGLAGDPWRALPG